jgi:hypothetical protein
VGLVLLLKELRRRCLLFRWMQCPQKAGHVFLKELGLLLLFLLLRRY